MLFRYQSTLLQKGRRSRLLELPQCKACIRRYVSYMCDRGCISIRGVWIGTLYTFFIYYCRDTKSSISYGKKFITSNSFIKRYILTWISIST